MLKKRLKERNILLTKASWFLALLLVAGFTSCTSSQKVVYFQGANDNDLFETTANLEPVLRAGDMLLINISATNAEAAIPFNLYETPTVGNLANARPMLYLVNPDGEINFPVLGKVEVGGLTTLQLRGKMEKLLLEYIKEPTINIRLTNFQVTVLGEVNSPGRYTVPNERLSALEAIGLAGDLTIYGRRDSVLLIRELDEKKELSTLDLTNKDVLKSPHYYLKQNDVLYVVPNKTKVNAAGVGPNTSVIISSVSVLITLLAVLLR